jgi:hypothetical protein
MELIQNSVTYFGIKFTEMGRTRSDPRPYIVNTNISCFNHYDGTAQKVYFY